MAAPTMTPEQRAAALEKARVVRAARSEITTKMSMGVMSPAEVLDKSEAPIIGRMKVKAFINAVPGFGKVKTEKLMADYPAVFVYEIPCRLLDKSIKLLLFCVVIGVG